MSIERQFSLQSRENQKIGIDAEKLASNQFRLRLLDANIVLGHATDDFGVIIAKIEAKNNVIENNIRSKKLEQYNKEKQSLENKLSTLDSEIITIKNSSNAIDKKPKKTVANSRDRAFLKLEQQQRLKESASLAKNLSQDQALRIQRQKQRLESIEKKLKEEEEQDRVNAERMAEEKHKQRKLRNRRLNEQYKERNEELKILNQSAPWLPGRGSKPLYLRIQEQYEVPPDTNADKNKRQDYMERVRNNPHSKGKLDDWNKSFLDMQKQRQSAQLLQKDKKIFNLSGPQNYEPSYKSQFYNVYTKETKSATMQVTKQKEKRKIIHERRLKFSKNIAIPPIDPNKKQQLEEKIQKLTHSAQPKTYSPEMTFERKPIRPNPLLPKPKQKRTLMESNSVDFLAQRREFRENQGFQETQTDIDMPSAILNPEEITNEELEINKLQEKIRKVENQAYYRKAILNSAQDNNYQAIEASEKVDAAILSTIKAKLKILELRDTDQQ